MNAVKLLVVTAFVACICWLLPSAATSSRFHCTTNTNTSFELSWSGDLPQAYHMQIFFHDFTHTFTMNGGGNARIVVNVVSSEEVLSVGSIAICKSSFACTVFGAGLSGTINVDVNTHFLGDVPEEKRKSHQKNKAVEAIIEKIKQL